MSADDAVAELRALRSALDAEHAQFRHQAAQRAELRSVAAREGRCGDDVRRIQRRVDAGSTTWRAVWSGTDTDPAAARLRHRVLARLVEIGAAIRAEE